MCPEKLIFKDYLTGNKREYILKDGENILKQKCLFDNTSLISSPDKIHNILICPNCNTQYSNLHSDEMKKDKDILVKDYKEKLKIIHKEETKLLRMLELAENPLKRGLH